jgi:hypothetical protein
LLFYFINDNLKTDMTGTSPFPNHHDLLPDTLLESFPSAPTSLRSTSPPDHMSMARRDDADVEDNDDVDGCQDALNDADATSMHDAVTDNEMMTNSEKRDGRPLADSDKVVSDVETQSKRQEKHTVTYTLTAAIYTQFKADCTQGNMPDVELDDISANRRTIPSSGDSDCEDDPDLTADLADNSSARRHTRNVHQSWWKNPDQATIRRLMGISANVPKQEQEKQSRLMRKKVKDICASIGITLRETWTDYKNDGLVDGMVSGQYSSLLIASVFAITLMNLCSGLKEYGKI